MTQGPTALRHPLVLITTLIAALAIATSVSFRLFETDFWQHLVVGKAIWQMHGVPSTHLWTWPGLGKPEVLPSWLFCALVWPFWVVGGVWGLFVWRWLTTLVAFGLLWSVARRLGTRPRLAGGARGVQPRLSPALPDSARDPGRCADGASALDPGDAPAGRAQSRSLAGGHRLRVDQRSPFLLGGPDGDRDLLARRLAPQAARAAQGRRACPRPYGAGTSPARDRSGVLSQPLRVAQRRDTVRVFLRVAA